MDASRFGGFATGHSVAHEAARSAFCMKICLTCEGVLDGDDASCAHCGGVLLDTRSVLVPSRRGDEESHGPLIGRVVDGEYRVVGVLGRGGMGTVYQIGRASCRERV